MKVLIEVARGYIVMKPHEKKEDENTIILDPKLQQEMDMAKSPFFEIVQSHPSNDYKIGDKVCFRGSADIGWAKFPTTEGVIQFLITREDEVLAKEVLE